jgi:hypothetical protein
VCNLVLANLQTNNRTKKEREKRKRKRKKLKWRTKEINRERW